MCVSVLLMCLMMSGIEFVGYSDWFGYILFVMFVLLVIC